ncbi:MAG: extracellular solute-binding protein [Clostridia bacterium]|nr:extracellular solute-binding protein [Clostridia bacterium]MBR4537417.1 extracellular solute-binding protein [Clostridia bacterium]
MKLFSRFLAILLVLSLLPLACTALAEEPVTITIWGSDRENMPFRNGLQMIEILKERLGINIEIISAPTESLAEKYGLLMAGGDIPTIVQYKAKDLLLYKDAWQPLNDMINETDTPNLYKVYSDPDIRRKVSDADGNMRFIGQRTAITAGKLYFYRQDWLDKLGLETPKTVEDLYNVFVAIRDGDPNGNGEKDEVPFSVRKNGSNNRGNVIPFVHNWGIAETFFAEDGQVKFGATDPRMKDALEWLHRCYEEKLLDQEYLTRDKTAWYSEWTNDQVFMSYDWSAYIDNVANLFKGQDSDVHIVGAVPPEGPTGISETRDQLQPITVDEDWNASIFAGASAEQKAAAMKLFDYLYSEEGMILMNFGVEGQHYNVIDGDYVYSDLIMNNPDGLSPQDALRTFGIQSMLTLLQDARYERAFVSDEVNRIRDIYEQEGHIGDAFPTLAFTNDEQSVINEKYTEIETYINEMIDKFIMGVEPLDHFDAYAAQVESMGLKDVLKVYQDAYDRYMK